MSDSVDVTVVRVESEPPISISWWVLLVVGIASIAIGIAAMVWPKPTLTVIGILFGAYLAFWGSIGLLHAITAPDDTPTGLRIVVLDVRDCARDGPRIAREHAVSQRRDHLASSCRAMTRR